MNGTQKMAMVTVVRAWLRSYGLATVLSALYEAIYRERRSKVYDRESTRN